MQIHNDVAFNIQEVFENTITQFRGKNLKIADGCVLLAHHKVPCRFEVERTGGDEVLGGQTGGSQPVPRETERLHGVHAEDVMEYLEPFMAIQHLCADAHSLEIVNKIGFNAFQSGFCSLQTVGINTESQILGFHQAVVASGKLVLQHFRILGTDAVKVIPLGRDGNTLSKGLLGSGQIHKRKLELHGAVKVVEEVTPTVEDLLLVLVAGELVVDVTELDGFGEMRFCNPTNTVGSHTQIRDAVLGGNLFLIRLFRS